MRINVDRDFVLTVEWTNGIPYLPAHNRLEDLIKALETVHTFSPVKSFEFATSIVAGTVIGTEHLTLANHQKFDTTYHFDPTPTLTFGAVTGAWSINLLIARRPIQPWIVREVIEFGLTSIDYERA